MLHHRIRQRKSTMNTIYPLAYNASTIPHNQTESDQNVSIILAALSNMYAILHNNDDRV